MSFLSGRKAVLATMHGKEKVIKPILEKEFGLEIVLPSDFDTDRFGTFTMDIERSGSQLEAARLKALSAMEIMGLDLAIASEGSFGADPRIPFIQSNLELVLLIDRKHSIEVLGAHRSGETNMSGRYVSSVEEAVNFAKEIGFPDHAVVIRNKEKGRGLVYKGIKTEEELRTRVQKLLSHLFTKRVYIETDMRAHMNPTRMDKIAKATENLVSNLKKILS